MEKKIFDERFVHCMWNNSLKDKTVFVSDDVYNLKVFVEKNTRAGVRHVFGSESGDNSYPFVVSGTDDKHKEIFRFVYYDPLYDIKWAWKNGKQIQCRIHFGIWMDTSSPDWDNKSLEFRVKPAEPVYRPFKDIQELKSTFLSLCFSAAIPANTEPSIWVRSKSSVTSTFMITHFSGNMGTVHLFSSMSISLEQLFNDYTFLDGTPCGVKED